MEEVEVAAQLLPAEARVRVQEQLELVAEAVDVSQRVLLVG